jgi:hypothetical protein
MENKEPRLDEKGRPATSICYTCDKEYLLDYTDEEEYGDELRPRTGDCGKHDWKSGHGYPM